MPRKAANKVKLTDAAVRRYIRPLFGDLECREMTRTTCCGGGEAGKNNVVAFPRRA